MTWLPWSGCGRVVKLTADRLDALLELAGVVLLPGGGSWKLMLIWCCCLVVEAGSWYWFGAAAWWWKLEADLVLHIIAWISGAGCRSLEQMPGSLRGCPGATGCADLLNFADLVLLTGGGSWCWFSGCPQANLTGNSGSNITQRMSKNQLIIPILSWIDVCLLSNNVIL